MSVICLLDTSYLLELYKVPDYHDPLFSQKAIERVKIYTELNAQFIVTLPCALEFIGHAIDSRQRALARAAANRFLEHFRSSRMSTNPWTITPSYDNSEAFETAAQSSLTDFWDLGLSLCDIFTVLEARRLNAKYRSNGYDVYILTRDSGLKSLEPNAEADPLV